MAISVSSLTSGNNDADQANYVTASISPSAGNVWLLWTQATHNTVDSTPADPSASGAGLTWTFKKSDVFNTSAGGRRTKIALLVGTGTPSAGAVTIAWGATMTSCQYDIQEVSGAGTTDPIVQNPSAVSATAGATSGSVTLSAAGDSNNRAFCAFGHAAQEATTFRTNWTEIIDTQGTASPSRGFETQWRSDAFETTASATWTTSVTWGGIAAEISAAVVAASGYQPGFRYGFT